MSSKYFCPPSGWCFIHFTISICSGFSPMFWALSHEDYGFCVTEEIEEIVLSGILSVAVLPTPSQNNKESFLRTLPSLPHEYLVGFLEGEPEGGCQVPYVCSPRDFTLLQSPLTGSYGVCYCMPQEATACILFLFMVAYVSVDFSLVSWPDTSVLWHIKDNRYFAVCPAFFCKSRCEMILSSSLHLREWNWKPSYCFSSTYYDAENLSPSKEAGRSVNINQHAVLHYLC